jgi:hypothetical protein
MSNDGRMIDPREMIANLQVERDALIAKADALTHAISNLTTAYGITILHSAKPLSRPSKPISARAVKVASTPSLIGRKIDRRKVPIPNLPDDPEFAPPDEADDTWVSIDTVSASPMAIGMAVLRSFPRRTISSAILNNRIAVIRNVEGGAGYTILDKLRKDGVIEGDNAEWTIKDASKGGVFKGERLWSPPQHLSEYDWAAIRREGILALLRANHALTIAGITKGLTAWKWYRAPATDDLVKADVRALAKKGLVHRNDDTKEWSLTNGISER